MPDTPIPAPGSEAELLDWLRLIRSRRVGPATFFRLVMEYGSAAAALAALPRIAAEAGVKDYTPCSEATARAEIDAGRKAGAALIPFGDPRYPVALAEIADAPPLLWARGRAELLTRPKLALVGARNASSLGLRMARRLAGDLSEAGHLPVSGMARGIDAAVHEAAKDKASIAVLPGGIDVIYPRELTDLAHLIRAHGLCLAERPPGHSPRPHDFLHRNRIISALAPATVVIEAAARSGSLSTARAALDQGRDVFAVPGHPFEARAAGCNMLIRDGARLVRSATDILEELALPGTPHRPPDEPVTQAPDTAPTDLTAEILHRLSDTPQTADHLIAGLAQPANLVARAMASLEMTGQILRRPDGCIARA